MLKHLHEDTETPPLIAGRTPAYEQSQFQGKMLTVYVVENLNWRITLVVTECNVTLRAVVRIVWHVVLYEPSI